jgi:hypothetical protein
MAQPDDHDRDFEQEARIRFPWLGRKSREECRLLAGYLRPQDPAVETAWRRAIGLSIVTCVTVLAVVFLVLR